jgi:hypothetical protein
VAVLAPLSAGVTLLAFLLWHTVRTTALAFSHETDHWLGARDLAYRRAASYLRANVHARERVAAVEVGTLGYYTDLRFHDLGQIVTRDPTHVPHDVRWVVVDPGYLRLVPRMAPVAVFRSGTFFALVFDLRRPPGIRSPGPNGDRG